MKDAESRPGNSLAGKLNHLFMRVRPAGRDRYTSEEVARAITASGIPISGSYVWLLRKGKRDNPTLRHVEGLARFFGVPPAYFFDDDVTEAVDAELSLRVALQDAEVQRITLGAAGLSERSLKSIGDVIARVRELEGLSRESSGVDR